MNSLIRILLTLLRRCLDTSQPYPDVFRHCQPGGSDLPGAGGERGPHAPVPVEQPHRDHQSGSGQGYPHRSRELRPVRATAAYGYQRSARLRGHDADALWFPPPRHRRGQEEGDAGVSDGVAGSARAVHVAHDRQDPRLHLDGDTERTGCQRALPVDRLQRRSTGGQPHPVGRIPGRSTCARCRSTRRSRATPCR